MEFALWGLFWILIVIAFLGCFISKFPGPILALVAILIGKFFLPAGELIQWWNIVIIVALVALSVVLNRMIPKWSESIAKFGKGGSWGTVVGSILTLLLAPAITDIHPAGLAISFLLISFVVLPFIFATVFEFAKQKNLVEAARSGGGATLVFVCTSCVKLLAVFYAVYLMIFNN